MPDAPPPAPAPERPIGCPFCGATPEERADELYRHFWIVCPNKDCPVEPETVPYEKHTEAWAAWNARAIPQPAPAPGWKPIETAPKDGTWIMTIIDAPGCHPGVVAWQTHYGRSRWAEDPGNHEIEECWKEGFLIGSYSPSHWQPLPPPPGACLEPAPVVSHETAFGDTQAGLLVADETQEPAPDAYAAGAEAMRRAAVEAVQHEIDRAKASPLYRPDDHAVANAISGAECAIRAIASLPIPPGATVALPSGVNAPPPDEGDGGAGIPAASSRRGHPGLPDRAWLIPDPHGRGRWYDADVGGGCEEYIKGALAARGGSHD